MTWDLCRIGAPPVTIAGGGAQIRLRDWRISNRTLAVTTASGALGGQRPLDTSA